MDKLLFRPAIYQRRFSQSSVRDRCRDGSSESDENDSGANTAHTSQEELSEEYSDHNGRPRSPSLDSGTSTMQNANNESRDSSDLNVSFAEGCSDPNSDSEQPSYFKRAATPIDYPKPVVKIYPCVRGVEVLMSPAEKTDKFEFDTGVEEMEEGGETKSQAQLEFEENSKSSGGTVGGIVKELYERHAKLRLSVGLPEESSIQRDQESSTDIPYCGNLDELAARVSRDPSKPNPYALLARYRQRRYSGSDIPDCSRLTAVEFDNDDAFGNDNASIESDGPRGKFHPIFSKDDLSRRPSRLGGAGVQELLEKYAKYSNMTPRSRLKDINGIKPILYTGDEDKKRAERATDPWASIGYKPFITRNISRENRTQKVPLRNIPRDVSSREMSRGFRERNSSSQQFCDDDVFSPLDDSFDAEDVFQSGTTTPKFSNTSKILQSSPNGEQLSKYLASRLAEKMPSPEPRPPSPTALIHQEAEAILDRHKMSKRPLSTTSEPSPATIQPIDENPLIMKYRSLSERKQSPEGTSHRSSRRRIVVNHAHEFVNPGLRNGHVDSSFSVHGAVLGESDTDPHPMGGYSRRTCSDPEPSERTRRDFRSDLSRDRFSRTSDTFEDGSESFGSRSGSVGSWSDSSGASYSPASRQESKLSSFSDRFNFRRRSSTAEDDFQQFSDQFRTPPNYSDSGRFLTNGISSAESTTRPASRFVYTRREYGTPDPRNSDWGYQFERRPRTSSDFSSFVEIGDI